MWYPSLGGHTPGYLEDSGLWGKGSDFMGKQLFFTLFPENFPQSPESSG